MTNKIPQFSLLAKELLDKRPRIVAVEAQKFFKESFVKGGFTDSSFQPWAKRSSPLGGNKILIGGAGANSMNLMQSIRTLEESEKQVRTGTDLIKVKEGLTKEYMKRLIHKQWGQKDRLSIKKIILINKGKVYKWTRPL